jgi:hypothetical protein
VAPIQVANNVGCTVNAGLLPLRAAPSPLANYPLIKYGGSVFGNSARDADGVLPASTTGYITNIVAN